MRLQYYGNPNAFLHKYVNPRYHIEPMHLAITQKLDAVARGEIKCLMIFATPQHGKSSMASEMFPVYHIGRNPMLPVMVTSYGAELAYKKSLIATI